MTATEVAADARGDAGPLRGGNGKQYGPHPVSAIRIAIRAADEGCVEDGEPLPGQGVSHGVRAYIGPLETNICIGDHYPAANGRFAGCCVEPHGNTRDLPEHNTIAGDARHLGIQVSLYCHAHSHTVNGIVCDQGR